MVIILSVAVFFAVTAIILSGYRLVTAESPLSRRLRTMAPTVALGDAIPAAEKQPSPAQRALAALGQFGVGGNDRSLSERLAVAGMRGPNAAALFLGTRTLISVGPALLFLVPRISSGQPIGPSMLQAAIPWAIGHMLANMWLRRRAKKRMAAIVRGLPDSLDLIVVSMEAGLGLNATIARVGQERSALGDELGKEFSIVAREIRDGRSREDALRALGERNGVEDLKSLAGLIIQSDRLGASMAKTLRAHADVLRSKRAQRAEELARKLPIKILFPLALFILPPLFVMVLGPAVLRIQELTSFVSGPR